MKKHLTIAGGGLAGLSLGIALRRRGVEVSIMEAGRYPRHRVCGEFISGVSAETLSCLGILDLFKDARRHRSLSWFDRGHLILTDHLPQAALGLSRHALDERLALRFQQLGGRLHCGERVRPVPEEGMVWAAGRRPRTGRWIGLKAHVRIGTSTDLEMHSGSNGYCGLAGVEDGWTNVCGLFLIDRGIDARGADLLPAYLEAGGQPRLADALRAAVWREGSFSSVAGFELGVQARVPGLLCLGDAESMIPPFTGNGMSMAFQAAEHAVSPLAVWASADAPWHEACCQIRSRLRRGFRRRLVAAGIMHRALFQTGMREAVATVSATRLLPFRCFLSLVR